MVAHTLSPTSFLISTPMSLTVPLGHALLVG
jgi:hypothetical protein